jgi:hypothetical protein
VTASPLGPSFVLIPAPSDDDALLGRILPRLPQPGQSLEELARPNPCAALLEPSKTSAMVNSYENAEELSGNARAKATLGTFGFSGDVSRATHFIYRLRTDRRESRLDTEEYQRCCKEKGCGVGYVATLVYGQGEYASGEEVSGGLSVDVAFVAGTSGSVGLKVLNKRNVSGWIAAIVRLNEASGDAALGALGAAGQQLATENELPAQVKSLYESERLRLVNTVAEDKNDRRPTYAFADGQGEITENEFIRRFEKVTGSPELDELDTRRNWDVLATMSIATAVIAGPTAAFCGGLKGFASEAFSDKGSTAGSLACGAGVLTSYLFVLSTPIAFFSGPDGKTNNHRLTQYDARLLVGRYNRSLLRKAVQDVQGANQTSRSEITIKPFVGPLSLGVWGTF